MSDDAILRALTGTPRTAREIAEAAGVSRQSAGSALKRLAADGRVAVFPKEGRTPVRYSAIAYAVRPEEAEEQQEPTEEEVSKALDFDVVANLVRMHGPMTSREIIARTGMDGARVVTVLNALVKDKRIVRSGRGTIMYEGVRR